MDKSGVEAMGGAVPEQLPRRNRSFIRTGINYRDGVIRRQRPPRGHGHQRLQLPGVQRHSRHPLNTDDAALIDATSGKTDRQA